MAILDDILQIIIWFINSMGLNNLMNNIQGSNKVKLGQKKANILQHWLSSGHNIFYTWMMFGWCQLPNDYPSYDSAGPL